MPINHKKVQATRRRTLFPLSSRDLCKYRSLICYGLKRGGHSIAEIRQIMSLTPDRVRGYLAKANRILNGWPKV
jgi:DNA-binding CsgD family transcriptional regulator